MSKNLVIVESPAKAKTIEGYLGKDYSVKSSFGHVRDLPKDDFAVDIKNDFNPTYVVPKDKVEIVKKLKKDAEISDLVYLASDDDREGEAISWHLMEALDIAEEKTRRIVFREITKDAILNAIDNPRSIDHSLVNAQQARRVLDRLVGFELSPILWRKIKAGLSAGRVQSVAARLVVDREREISNFEINSFFKVNAFFNLQNGAVLKAELSERLKVEEEARSLLENCIPAKYHIENLEKKPSKKSPAPPFTTSTLQQEASRKLGFSVAQTMAIAQRLYEAGKITYMRTDSLNLSNEAIQKAKSQIESSFGQEFVHTRKYKTKSQSAQEAHEAIRPTSFNTLTLDGVRNDKRLYELIWKRAIASQMANAQIEKTVVTINISTDSRKLTATGEVVKFEGFLKVYIESSDDENSVDENKGMLPPLSIGQSLQLKEMIARQGFTRPPARYTEASLVKKLEELGIGRPSTFAPTISVIQKRHYVVKEPVEGKERIYRELTLSNGNIHGKSGKEIVGADKNKLIPTDMGMIVNDFLVENFPNIIDYSFTAKIEEQFDEISRGNIEWSKMIDGFYSKFHPQILETANAKTKGKVREIGIVPETGKKVIARMARFGPIVQIGENGEDEKPKFASLKKGQRIESISLEEALALFKLPREIGDFENTLMIAGIGKFGPYIRHNNKFYSLGNEDDAETVAVERAIEIIEEKRKQDAQKIIKVFEEDPHVQVLNGKWGPYIKFGKKNIKIPSGTDPSSLTFEECKKLAKEVTTKKKMKK